MPDLNPAQFPEQAVTEMGKRMPTWGPYDIGAGEHLIHAKLETGHDLMITHSAEFPGRWSFGLHSGVETDDERMIDPPGAPYLTTGTSERASHDGLPQDVPAMAHKYLSHPDTRTAIQEDMRRRRA